LTWKNHGEGGVRGEGKEGRKVKRRK